MNRNEIISQSTGKGLCGNIIEVPETVMESVRSADLTGKGIPVYDPAKPEDARIIDLETKINSYSKDYCRLLSLGNLPGVDTIAQRLDEIESQIAA